MRNYNQSGPTLNQQKDRISSILSNQVSPRTNLLTDINDISQSYLASLSQGGGAASFNKNYSTIKENRANQEQQAYNILQDSIKQGNEDAGAVDQAIRRVVGDDIKTYNVIANELHKMPDRVDRTNANLAVARVAGRLNYKPISQKINELEFEAAKSKIANPAQSNNIDPVLARQADKDIVLKTRESANGANDSLRSIQAIENALFDKNGKPRVSTGKPQASAQYIGQFIPGINSAPYQDVESKATKLSLSVASMLKGQTSDKDVARSLMTAPGYDKSPEANKKIIRDQKAALKVIAESPKFIADWRNKYSSTLGVDENGRSFDEAYLDWQSNRFKELGGESEGQENFNDFKIINIRDKNANSGN